MYKKRVWKNFRGSRELPQAYEKVCNKNERKKKKIRLLRQKFFWKEGFIRPYQKTDWTNFDELQVIDSSNNEVLILE